MDFDENSSGGFAVVVFLLNLIVSLDWWWWWWCIGSSSSSSSHSHRRSSPRSKSPLQQQWWWAPPPPPPPYTPAPAAVQSFFFFFSLPCFLEPSSSDDSSCRRRRRSSSSSRSLEYLGDGEAIAVVGVVESEWWDNQVCSIHHSSFSSFVCICFLCLLGRFCSLRQMQETPTCVLWTKNPPLSFVFFLLTWDDHGWWVAEILQEETECVKNLDETSSPELFHSPQELISIRLIFIAIIIAAAASASINSKAALSLYLSLPVQSFWVGYYHPHEEEWRHFSLIFSGFHCHDWLLLPLLLFGKIITRVTRCPPNLPAFFFMIWCNSFQSCCWELFYCEDQISELQKNYHWLVLRQQQFKRKCRGAWKFGAYFFFSFATIHLQLPFSQDIHAGEALVLVARIGEEVEWEIEIDLSRVRIKERKNPAQIMHLWLMFSVCPDRNWLIFSSIFLPPFWLSAQDVEAEHPAKKISTRKNSQFMLDTKWNIISYGRRNSGLADTNGIWSSSASDRIKRNQTATACNGNWRWVSHNMWASELGQRERESHWDLHFSVTRSEMYPSL